MTTSSALRVIFAGTPEFAATALDALIHSDHEVTAVYTQPDRPAGRGRHLTSSPVKQLAVEQGITVYQPVNFKDLETPQTLKTIPADVMIVAAYGLILPKAVLQTPALGCLNIHASLLPRWRGAAPIQRAILAGDQETGITIMQMDKNLDTGDILLKQSLIIENMDTGTSLHDKLAVLGANTMLQALEQLPAGTLNATQQDSALATYAQKLSKQEARIDWQQPAEQIARQVRAFNSWPVAQTEFTSKILRLWQAHPVNEATRLPPGTIINVDRQGLQVACGENSLMITELQLSGAKCMSMQALLNGHPDLFSPGQTFS